MDASDVVMRCKELGTSLTMTSRNDDSARDRVRRCGGGGGAEMKKIKTANFVVVSIKSFRSLTCYFHAAVLLASLVRCNCYGS